MRNDLKGAEHHRSRRGRVVSARLYSVQTGLAQTMSKCPGGNVVWSQLRMSQRMAGSNFDTMSRETTSQPAASKALPTNLVPQKSSRSLGIFKEQDHRDYDENSHVHRTGLFSYG